LTRSNGAVDGDGADRVGPTPPRSSMTQRILGAAAGARLLLGGGNRAPGAIIFGYHDVGPSAGNDTDYYLTAEKLRRQLLQATSAGLRFVPLGEITRRFLSGDPLDGLSAVAFDDGLAGVHHHAMPVLLELGVPATVFTVTDALGVDPPWWPGAQRVMTPAELAELAAAGFDIASHTRSHPSLPALSEVELRNEVAGARAALEDLTGRPVTTFAYPFGHHDGRVRHAVLEAGYEAAFTFLNGRVDHGLDRFILPRLTMSDDQGRLRLAYHLARNWPDHQLEVVRHVAR
jgi:peptidoglycan/xylan/chitin deacetylase (PgdA/CDA1 family)